jgi:hypothetical protein
MSHQSHRRDKTAVLVRGEDHVELIKPQTTDSQRRYPLVDQTVHLYR